VETGHIRFIGAGAIGERDKPDTVSAEFLHWIRRAFGEMDDMHRESSRSRASEFCLHPDPICRDVCVDVKEYFIPTVHFRTAALQAIRQFRRRALPHARPSDRVAPA
jgi:hypothetical protein